MRARVRAALPAITAAALYALNVPLSKLLLVHVGPLMLAGLLYLGAGFGLLAVSACGAALGRNVVKEPLTRAELPYTAAMVVLDIAAPILMMLGLAVTSSANAALLNNFEIAATTLIAFALYREFISKRLLGAVVLITIASMLLGFEGEGSFDFNVGSLLVLGACVCWGFENNCTRCLSGKSSVEIVTIKGVFSGFGSLAVALLSGESLPQLRWAAAALALGLASYGLSINFYILAQKELGAAKTSAWYSVAPFLGVLFSVVLLGERPGALFYAALAVMAAAAVLMARDGAVRHTHEHAHAHTHAHCHDGVWHTHEHAHTHTHEHTHGNGREHAHGNDEMHVHAHTPKETAL